MSKHTAGSWGVDNSASYFGTEDFIQEHNCVVVNGPLPPFALGFALAIITGSSIDNNTRDANARLIAAAPDLYRELAGVAVLLEARCAVVEGEREKWGRTLEDIKAALLKAGG